MAWPSGTKAVTTNVDAGADLISLARPDIKQNIDNVNEIIDHLNISSPSNGDLLQYSSSSGKWEQVQATSVGTQVAFFSLEADNLPQGNFTDKHDLIQVIEKADAGSFATVSGDSGSNFGLQLTAGKYIIGVSESDKASGMISFTLNVRNEPDSSGDGFNLSINHLDDTLKQSIQYLDTSIHGVDLIFDFDYNNNVVQDAFYRGQLLITKLG
jgi:hypothetical protein|tara:strand:+ start:2827 stop:3462 length:636 start_codon:yes stop_codon:yes gene_type:complete